MDCENCPIPRLWDCNLEAWYFYQRIANQFVYDFHALPLVFELYRPRLTLGEARLLFEKLVIVHAEINKKKDDHGGEGNLPQTGD